MKKELVKYHNDLNLFDLSSWNPNEMNLFFGIIAKLSVFDDPRKIVKNRTNDFGFEPLTCTLSKQEIKDMLNITDKKMKDVDFDNLIDGLIKKVRKVSFVYSKDGIDYYDNMFGPFRRNRNDNDKYLYVETSPFFDFLFRLYSEFTLFELRMFLQMKSTYSKTLFRLLKQWRFEGQVEFQLDDFKKRLGIPPGYRNKDINSRILKQIQTDFDSVHAFDDFHMDVIKDDRKITGYVFTFKPEERVVPKKFKGIVEHMEIQEKKFNEWLKKPLYEKDSEMLKPAPPDDINLIHSEALIRNLYDDTECDLFAQEYLKILKDKGKVTDDEMDIIADGINPDRDKSYW